MSILLLNSFNIGWGLPNFVFLKSYLTQWKFSEEAVTLLCHPLLWGYCWWLLAPGDGLRCGVGLRWSPAAGLPPRGALRLCDLLRWWSPGLGDLWDLPWSRGAGLRDRLWSPSPPDGLRCWGDLLLRFSLLAEPLWPPSAEWLRSLLRPPPADPLRPRLPEWRPPALRRTGDLDPERDLEREWRRAGDLLRPFLAPLWLRER